MNLDRYMVAENYSFRCRRLAILLLATESIFFERVDGPSDGEAELGVFVAE